MKKIAYAINERAFDDGEWQQITPYGEFGNEAGRQIVTREAAEAMVQAFNSLLGRVSRGVRGLPIYVGHPDVLPQEYSDHRRYGKIIALEAREDGLWGKPAWNALGEENRVNGYYVYPSPVWHYRANDDGTITPVELVSVGMTNFPNIAESAPWTLNDNPNPAGEPAQRKDKTTMPEWLLNILGLAAEATEEEARAALETLQATAAEVDTLRTKVTDLEGRLTAAQSEKTAAETTAANERSARATLLIDTAINEGRVLPSDRERWATAFNSNFADATTRLGKETQKLNRTALNTDAVRENIATPEARGAVLQAAVNERISQGMSRIAAWKAVKADPKYKPVFEAMAQKS